MRTMSKRLAVVLILTSALWACDQQDVVAPEDSTEAGHGRAAAMASPLEGPYTLNPPVFDIAPTPQGGILAVEFATVKEIHRNGVSTVIDLPTVEGFEAFGEEAVTPINGLYANGRRDFFAARGGLDLAEGAGLFRVSQGEARLVADIQAFEEAHDPDATEGPQWKDLRCEELGGFSAGPQSNPYHLTGLSGSEVLIGDAAGNTVLRAKSNGDVDWVAVITPPEGETGDWMILAPLDEDTDCYVQPVPTSVAIGPDGAYYVGELTGVTLGDLTGDPSSGLSRVWRIDPGSRNVVCPSSACQEVVSGLTSIIDVEFGPDGRLWVVEYDQAGWFAALELESGVGGAIQRCNVNTGDCTLVEDGLTLPGAIVFDSWDTPWVLEDNLGVAGGPTVRQVDLP